MLIDTHISTHYKSHAFEQAYIIRGYGEGREKKTLFSNQSSETPLTSFP